MDLHRGSRQMLESLGRAGITSLPRAAAAPVAPATESPRPIESMAPRQTATAKPVASQLLPLDGGVEAASGSHVGLTARGSPEERSPEERSPEERPAALQVIAAEVAGCTRCAELVANRSRTVFGVGNPSARLCFMGEAPGADEDRQGIPFVGAAGQLLTKIIENGLKMRRDDVYILNILKCRPPGNRQPTPEEATNCRGFLDRQLDIIQPEFICCLGATAAQNLLGSTQSIGRMRGRTYDYRGSKAIVTYHPAYLLRNPAAKKDVWDDMKLLLREMGLPAPD
jgi:DNA polymerase